MGSYYYARLYAERLERANERRRIQSCLEAAGLGIKQVDGRQG